MFVEAATQLEVSELEVETIPDLNLGVLTMTPEQSQDTELVEGELQQQENVEVDQDVVTQEPTSSENLAETPIRLGATDLEVEIIPNVEVGEDEQMQSQQSRDTEAFGDQSHLSGDTEILRDQPHISWDMEVTQEKPKFLEDLEEREVVTQEPTSLQLPVEATTKNQEVLAKSQEDTETRTQEDLATQEPTTSPLAAEVGKKRF